MPTFENAEKCHPDDDGTSKVPGGTFTENLLRNILDLTDWQQLELVTDVEGDEAKKKAVRENALNEESIPMTLVDFAEFIWRQQSTQKITANILGWSRDKVAKYEALDSISKEAWLVVVTTFENFGM